MLNHFFYALTDLGDSAVTSVLSLFFAVVLGLLKQKRAAAAILLVFFFTAFGIALGKLFLYSRCADTDSFLGVRSPSGHSAMSAAVYGMAAAIISASLSGKAKRIPFLIVVPFIFLMAASRVWVGAHTLVDAAIGTAWGALVGYGVWRVVLKGRAVQGPWWKLAGPMAVLLALLYGAHFPAEQILSWLSGLIRDHLLSCPD